MKEIKQPIAIIDMGLLSLSFVKSLHLAMPKEDILYINDDKGQDYENLMVIDKEKAISNFINNLIVNALAQNPKTILVISDVIIQYGKELFNSLPIPVIYIVDEIIKYVNDNYEYKNMAFLSSKSIIDAGIYQKEFHYNHLYSIAIDNMLSLINNPSPKTSESFKAIEKLLVPINQKKVNVIIPTKVNLLLFYTEYKEYTTNSILLPIDDILISAIRKVVDQSFETSKNGMIYLYINDQLTLNKENTNLNIYNKLVGTKYKIIDMKEKQK